MAQNALGKVVWTVMRFISSISPRVSTKRGYHEGYMSDLPLNPIKTKGDGLTYTQRYQGGFVQATEAYLYHSEKRLGKVHIGVDVVVRNVRRHTYSSRSGSEEETSQLLRVGWFHAASPQVDIGVRSLDERKVSRLSRKRGSMG